MVSELKTTILNPSKGFFLSYYNSLSLSDG